MTRRIVGVTAVLTRSAFREATKTPGSIATLAANPVGMTPNMSQPEIDHPLPIAHGPMTVVRLGRPLYH